MLDWLAAVGNMIVTVINLGIHMIESFIHLFTMIPTYVNFLISSINVLPVVLIPFITASISLYVILFVLGRN